MSSIGPAGFAAQIASSVANTKRTDAHASRTAESDAQHRSRVDNDPTARANDIGEVGEPDLDADRDPDGRRAWEFHGPPRPDDEAEDEREKRRNDSLDFLGGELDLEA